MVSPVRFRPSPSWIEVRPRFAGLAGRTSGGQTFEQAFDELGLQQDLVRSGFPHGLVQRGLVVSGERDQAEVRVIPPEASGSRDPVEQRHVEVDHDRVGIEVVGQLDRLESVLRCADDRKLGLALDELLKGGEEVAVVVGD